MKAYRFDCNEPALSSVIVISEIAIMTTTETRVMLTMKCGEKFIINTPDQPTATRLFNDICKAIGEA